jgi:hypothetical protein
MLVAIIITLITIIATALPSAIILPKLAAPLTNGFV